MIQGTFPIHDGRTKLRKGKEIGGQRLQPSENIARLIDNCYALSNTALHITATKVNSATLRFEPVNRDLLVAILTYLATQLLSYSVTHAVLMLIAFHFNFSFNLI